MNLSSSTGRLSNKSNSKLSYSVSVQLLSSKLKFKFSMAGTTIVEKKSEKKYCKENQLVKEKLVCFYSCLK